MGEYNEMMNQWVKERDEVCLSFDVKKFKEFYAKWKLLGVYNLPLPQDNVIEVMMRKMVLYMGHQPKEKLEEAKAWLIERGFES